LNFKLISFKKIWKGCHAPVVIPGSGGKYLMDMLYAGSKWSGVLKYRKK